jgi:hypothetical protein
MIRKGAFIECVCMVLFRERWPTLRSRFRFRLKSLMEGMRRAEIGHHHHIAGTYLLRYAQEATWREDNRRVTTRTVAALAMKCGPSVDFGGYWQRHIKAA